MKTAFYFLIFISSLQPAFSQCEMPTALTYTYDEDSIYFHWKGSPNALQYTFQYVHYNVTKSYVTSDTTFTLSLLNVQGDKNVLWMVKTHCDGVATDRAHSTFNVPSLYTCNQPTDLTYTYDEDSIYFHWKGSPSALQYTFQYVHYNVTKSYVTSDTTFTLSLLNVQGDKNVLWMVKTHCDGVATDRARSTFNVPSLYTCNQPTDLTYTYDEDSIYFHWKGSPNALQYTFQYVHYNVTKSYVTSDTTFTLSLLNVQGDKNVLWMVKTHCDGVATDRARSTFNVPSLYTCNQPTDLTYTYDEDSIYFHWKGSPNALQYTFQYVHYNVTKSYVTRDTTFTLSLLNVQGDANVLWMVKTQCDGVVTDRARSTFFVKVPQQYYTISSGNWSDPAIWSYTLEGPPANAVPSDEFEVNIVGYEVTIDQDATCKKLNLLADQPGAKLEIVNGKLTVSETINIEEGAYPIVGVVLKERGALKVGSGDGL